MKTPIAKLVSSLDHLDKDLKDVQRKESDAKLEAEKIANQIEELKAEVDGIIRNLMSHFTSTPGCVILVFLQQLDLKQLIFSKDDTYFTIVVIEAACPVCTSFCQL